VTEIERTREMGLSYDEKIHRRVMGSNPGKVQKEWSRCLSVTSLLVGGREKYKATSCSIKL
jgi:hypothetical protein